MLIFPGSVALSDFRRNKLLSALQAIVPTIPLCKPNTSISCAIAANCTPTNTPSCKRC
jgi:hypothetical protein